LLTHAAEGPRTRRHGMTDPTRDLQVNGTVTHGETWNDTSDV
jgi:hypothetical protein